MEITSGSPISDDPIRALALLAPLRKPVVGQALEALGLPAGSEGVDVGCGIGLEAVQLISAIGAEGHVTGVDISPGQVAAAQQLAEASGLAGRLSFVTGDIYELPFDGISSTGPGAATASATRRARHGSPWRRWRAW